MQSITIRNLWKRFNGNPVLRGLNASFEEGSVVAIVGPNGSGKTTLIRIIAGLTPPSEGFISVFGLKPGSSKARRFTSVVLDRPLLYEELTVEENLELFKTLSRSRGCRFYERALETLDVVRVWRRRVGELSHGWRRRVDFVRALITEPRLLLLDEITTAFDSESLREVESIVFDLARGGSTVIATDPGWGGVKLLSNSARYKCRLEDGVLECEIM
ncbi:MAG: ABC transporter ATP-binding protein [Desulfurococcaceae archaeon]|nr:ABC transporter ATP-binding protein [Desulfurococcaceae archaeon]MCC6060427.1 ABC transporter ATP-binding protein [Desulfurococcaceae archaeon]